MSSNSPNKHIRNFFDELSSTSSKSSSSGISQAYLQSMPSSLSLMPTVSNNTGSKKISPKSEDNSSLSSISKLTIPDLLGPVNIRGDLPLKDILCKADEINIKMEEDEYDSR